MATGATERRRGRSPTTTHGVKNHHNEEQTTTKRTCNREEKRKKTASEEKRCKRNEMQQTPIKEGENIMNIVDKNKLTSDNADVNINKRRQKNKAEAAETCGYDEAKG